MKAIGQFVVLRKKVEEVKSSSGLIMTQQQDQRLELKEKN